MMKKYLTIILMTFLFLALSAVALAGKRTIQDEVSLEKQQANISTSPMKKENRMSSTRIKDKIAAGETSANSSDNERMTRYKRFEDGEGEAKTKN